MVTQMRARLAQLPEDARVSYSSRPIAADIAPL
jgi:hypothetical protein